MGRDYARVKTSIWNDPDFLHLKTAEQHAYMMLMSNRGLSRCGVITYIPGRFRHLAADLTPAKFTAAVRGLAETRFVVVDDHTQELLLRSYVRHDGVLGRLNMGKATGSAFECVLSDAIRDVIGDELARLMKEEPDLPGWKGLAITSPTAHAMAYGMESGMP